MARGLGKGLGALIQPIADNEVLEVPVNQLRPNPYQPRKTFSEESLKELTTSIRQHGLIQPILVRQSVHGYEIVAGERRWRAAKAAKLDKIPVVIRDFNDDQVMEIALIENLQREDLNAMEIATAYQKLMERLQLTQEELAARVGKSRPHVANFLRLIHLPKQIQEMLSRDELSMGHARALLSIEDDEEKIRLAKEVVKKGLSVRELESIVQQARQDVPRETKESQANPDPEQARQEMVIQDLEERLCRSLGTAVKIRAGKTKGKIEISYHNQEDLQRLLDLLLLDERRDT